MLLLQLLQLLLLQLLLLPLLLLQLLLPLRRVLFDQLLLALLLLHLLLRRRRRERYARSLRHRSSNRCWSSDRRWHELTRALHCVDSTPLRTVQRSSSYLRRCAAAWRHSHVINSLGTAAAAANASASGDRAPSAFLLQCRRRAATTIHLMLIIGSHIVAIRTVFV